MNAGKSAEKYFQKKFRRNQFGYPIATVAYYGPDDQTATKVAVGIVDANEQVVEMKRWLVKAQDVRIDREINEEIVRFLKANQVKRVAMTGRIIGCPHEEGIDYPEGGKCPQCPYWAKIDRWTGKAL